jgi:hypothetical protein
VKLNNPDPLLAFLPGDLRQTFNFETALSFLLTSTTPSSTSAAFVTLGLGGGVTGEEGRKIGRSKFQSFNELQRLPTGREQQHHGSLSPPPPHNRTSFCFRGPWLPEK